MKMSWEPHSCLPCAKEEHIRPWILTKLASKSQQQKDRNSDYPKLCTFLITFMRVNSAWIAGSSNNFRAWTKQKLEFIKPWLNYDALFWIRIAQKSETGNSGLNVIDFRTENWKYSEKKSSHLLHRGFWHELQIIHCTLQMPNHGHQAHCK